MPLENPKAPAQSGQRVGTWGLRAGAGPTGGTRAGRGLSWAASGPKGSLGLSHRVGVALGGAGSVGQRQVGPRRTELGPEHRWAGHGRTVTLCCPVRLGDSQSSWVSDTVRVHGVEPMSTV